MAEPIDHEAAVAFATATARLRELTVELAAVQALVAGADARLSLSAGHVMRAATEARLAIRREKAIAVDIKAANVLLGAAQLSVEGQVRRTYQDGAAGAWGSVLAAEDAGDFTDRAADLRTVTDTRGHAVDLLARLPLRIEDLKAARTAAATTAKVARGDAKAAAAAHERLLTGISAARASIPTLEADMAAAVAAATAAIPADQALAVERRRESDRLAGEMVEAAAALKAAGGVVEGTGTFARPATGVVTSDYGWRIHPILGYRKLHTGIDYDGADDVVYAADSGVVIMTVWSNSYGNVTVIDHGMSGGKYFATFYAHQAGYLVNEGDVVQKGQPIGAVGSTGLSTGPHLHFEVRLDGAPVDPNPFLD